MGNRWKAEVSTTILNIFRPYNGIDVLKLPFLEELYEKTFVVSYVFYCDLQQLFIDNHEAGHYLKNFRCVALIHEPHVIAEFERLQAATPDSINGRKYIRLSIKKIMIYFHDYRKFHRLL